MPQNIYVSVFIPLKPHVKKYISVRYGESHQITKKSMLGILLLELVNKRYTKNTAPRDEKSELYEIGISERYFVRDGYNVAPKKARFIGECLEKLFMEDMQQDINRNISREVKKLSAMEAMRSFLNYYGISENDIKLETLYRNYQRYCKEGITEKKTKISQSRM